MKLITRDTDYAIRALCFIADKRDKLVSVAELTKAIKVPRPFLRKILQLLNRAGVLDSHKGVKGGFVLKREPDKIFLMDLMEIFQGRFSLNECFLKKLPCPNKNKCILRRQVGEIEKYIQKHLRPISISALLRKGVGNV